MPRLPPLSLPRALKHEEKESGLRFFLWTFIIAPTLVLPTPAIRAAADGQLAVAESGKA